MRTLDGSVLAWILVLASVSAASAQENEIPAVPDPPELPLLDDSTLPGCDPVDPARCLLPFPNDWFTAEDPTMPTGRRVAFLPHMMPRNVVGKPIDPVPWNLNDGFSPGSLIVTKVPGMDTPAAFEATGAAPITDIGSSLTDPDAPVLLLDDDGNRQLIFSEIDRAGDLNRPFGGSETHGDPPAPEDTTLLIRPARNLDEGGHYVVVLRNMKDGAGNGIPAREPFRVCRDEPGNADPLLEARCQHLEENVFPVLAKADVARDESLYLAWDFTVASETNLAERMLHIRNDAFAELGDTNLADLTIQGDTPEFVVTDVQDFTPEEDARIARRIEGRVIVPCYLGEPGCITGSRFVLNPATRLPERIPGNVAPANFVCNIPRTTVEDGVDPGRPLIIGHGLFGDATTVDSGKFKDSMRDHNMVMCATDWIGMASEDVPYAVAILADLSLFPGLADRVQQGMLNFLYLGRAMIHPDGFNTDPAFRFEGEGVIDTERLYYWGGSQGGIIGGSLTAVAPDFTRAALGVPGMNYSLLLRRSVDFDIFAEVLYRAYPDELERPLLISLIQMLWDRAESNGYAHHMTDDPYPNTPAHEVLLFPAFGDHQVTMWSAEIMARTVGAKIRTPVLDPDRHPDTVPYFGIDPIPSFPFDGSALVVWDVGPLRQIDGETKGTPPPPITNNPNRIGVDPHGPDASELPSGQLQISEFLKPEGESRIIDVCGDDPCYLDGWEGPGSGT